MCVQAHTKIKIRKFLLRGLWPFIRNFAPTNISFYTVCDTPVAVVTLFQLPSLKITITRVRVIFNLGLFKYIKKGNQKKVSGRFFKDKDSIASPFHFPFHHSSPFFSPAIRQE